MLALANTPCLTVLLIVELKMTLYGIFEKEKKLGYCNGIVPLATFIPSLNVLF